MTRPSWRRDCQNHGFDWQKGQEVCNDRPVWRGHSLNRRRGTRLTRGCSMNAVDLSQNRSGGVSQSKSQTPNSSQQWHWLLYDEWRPVGNRIANPTQLSRKEDFTQEMATFEDNVLWGAYQNLHPRIILHPLMLWLVVLPKETICLLMSIIGYMFGSNNGQLSAKTMNAIAMTHPIHWEGVIAGKQLKALEQGGSCKYIITHGSPSGKSCCMHHTAIWSNQSFGGRWLCHVWQWIQGLFFKFVFD